ncbi:hypothetical protein NQZ68_019216 [Dissostichus eleginoides]|nr:hypothetical protein NQZ68_019216 [Dissostichus eleginoides]
MQVDLEQKLTFPPEITTTNLRPDLIMTEVDEPYNSKWLKDSDIVAEAGQQGWKMWVLLVEVGCGGFVATSTTSQLKCQEDRYPRQDVKMQRLSTEATTGCG